jgi:septum formation protein
MASTSVPSVPRVPSLPTGPSVPLVLGSASPARLATLRRAGVTPYVLVSDVDEDSARTQAVSQYGELAPVDVALALARAKCEAVAGRLAGDSCPEDAPSGALVLGCDSVLDLDGELHGKPADEAEATSRWQRMRGRAGVLHTGHWLIDDRDESDGGTGATIGAVASTTVHFANISDQEIAAYVASGEPLQVAGAFTIDGLGGPFVSGIEGDHHNVVGLSLPLLRDLLGEISLSWFDLCS